VRVEVVRALVAQLQNDLQPNQVAHAHVRMPPEGDLGGAELDTDARPRSRFKFVDANFDGASSATLRLDQMLAVRFWRIGFTFETLDLCDEFAQQVVRSVTKRLATELNELHQILERFSKRTPNHELRIVPPPSGRRFEHLMLDILNEDGHHANMAPLVEDYSEKTDLRVKYPSLKRKRGARVQVTSITKPEHHQTKLDGIRLVEEFVFLSPLTLAEFVHSLQDHIPSRSISDTPSFASTPLWDCLEVKPADVPELASELRRIMFRALAGMPDSPLGPMVRVPQPIRQLIRLFVETRAIASTNTLREREKVNSRNLASSSNDFPCGYDSEIEAG
jgi:hypothetical protein